MLAAAIMSAIALAGGGDATWISPERAQEGTRYRAMTLWGKGELECGASIGNKTVQATVYRSATHDVCVLVIPKGAAGKWLHVGWSYTETSEPVAGTDENGVPVFRISTLHVDGLPYRRLIRAAPQERPHAGQPFAAYTLVQPGKLECVGFVGGKKVPVRYRTTAEATTCVFLIPKRTAGRWLHYVVNTTTLSEPILTGYTPDGQPLYQRVLVHADGTTARVRIRR